MAQEDPNRIVECKFCTKHLSKKSILRHCRTQHGRSDLKTKNCYNELQDECEDDYEIVKFLYVIDGNITPRGSIGGVKLQKKGRKILSKSRNFPLWVCLLQQQ